MNYDDYLKHAWSTYQKAIAEEGEQKRKHLQEARNILQNVPSGYKNRDDLMSRIEYML